MKVDDGVRWNIVDNTYIGNTWSRFKNKHSENLCIYVVSSHYIYFHKIDSDSVNIFFLFINVAAVTK